MQKYVLYFSQQTDGIYHNIDENYRCDLSYCKLAGYGSFVLCLY